MPFQTKTAQAVSEIRKSFGGLDTQTRGQVLSDLYTDHQALVEKEIEQIRSSASLPFASTSAAPRQVTSAARTATATTAPARGKRHLRKAKAQRVIRPSASAPTPKHKEGERRTRLGQRAMGSLFDAMLQVVAKQEKSKQGFATRQDILDMTKHVESKAETDKERYDLVGSYLQLLKRVRGLITTKQDEKGNEIKGQYYLTDKGRARIKELADANIDMLKAA